MVKELYENFNILSNFNYGSAKTVDYVGLPFEDNSMYNEFAENQNITRVTNINENVTNMRGAFKNCSNLTSIDKLPNGTENLRDTFCGCSNLVNVPVIPNSVTTMMQSFYSCSKLVNAPVIPNSVTNMHQTFSGCALVNAPDISNCLKVESLYKSFAYCRSLIETPIFPNNVTNIVGVCQGCISITSLPTIPNNITDISYSFDQCINVVNCNINIPNQITNMYSTFSRCSKLSGNIFIESESISDATDCFNGTTLAKNVYIPFTYENGVNTSTYNAFISAGYDETGTTNGVTLLDINPSVQYTLTINPTPADAIVTFTSPSTFVQSGNTITINSGSIVTYTVSKDGYKTYTSTVTVYENMEYDVILEEEEKEKTIDIDLTQFDYTVSSAGIYELNGYTGTNTELDFGTVTEENTNG